MQIHILKIVTTFFICTSPIFASTYKPNFSECPPTDHPSLSGSLCATKELPLDHSKPSDASIKIFVRKFLAQTAPAKGDIWFIAGGPGESGASFYPSISYLKNHFKEHNLIFPDHRGTGYSTALCPAEQNAQSPGGLDLRETEWRSCYMYLHKTAERTKQFNITNAAKDLDALISSLSPSKNVFIFATSYGTQLTLRALHFIKTKVKGTILDSLIPPEGDSQSDLSHRSFSVNQIGVSLLTKCRQQPHCRPLLNGKSDSELAKHFDSDSDNLKRFLPHSMTKDFLGSMLDDVELRTHIPALIEASMKKLQQAPKTLTTVMKSIEERQKKQTAFIQNRFSVPLSNLISASENSERPKLTKKLIETEERTLLFTSALSGHIVSHGLPLYPRDRYFASLRSTDIPVQVIQGALDPKTPMSAALKHISLLRKHGFKVGLLESKKSSHITIFDSNHCVLKSVKKFLLHQTPTNHTCD